jgi:hypothetical protein
MITDAAANKILKTYEEAWVEQDISKILSLFHADGTYHERVLKEPIRGRDGIADYWRIKVADEQSNIKFKLLNYYISGDTLIAEWEAFFESRIRKVHVHMKEVAIMEIQHDKIRSLREYWQSELSPLRPSKLHALRKMFGKYLGGF